jgi:hypothetical protein
MPAQILLTRQQIETIATLEHDVVVLEGPFGGDALDCWVMDDETLRTSTHRSVVIGSDGTVLGDSQLDD